MSAKPADVETYIAEAAPEARPHLKEIRALIHETLPEAEEHIKYGVPWYTYHGMLSGMTAYKNHITIEIWTDELRDKDRERLEAEGYKTGKRTFQVRYDQEVPAAAIRQVLQAKAAANEAS